MNDPATYVKVNCVARKFVSEMTDELEDVISKTSGQCLDIGSGPGDVAVDFILPKLNPKATIVCSDISDAMVDFGKERYKDNKRVSFIKLDIESPDLPKELMEQFCQVTSTYCLHWCQDMRQVFENIFNLLLPGGTVSLIFVAKFPAMTAFKELAAMPRYQPYMKDADRYIPVLQRSEQQHKTLKALIEDVGFEVQHFSIRKKVYVWEDPDVFEKFVVTINPLIERIPADLKEEYEKDLVKEAIKESIILNKNNNTKHENAILCVIRLCIVHLKKPFAK